MDNKWFIVQANNGKYADGYYGWDSTIHDSEQIFSEDELPYKQNPQMAFIFITSGDKPKPCYVMNILNST